jgi:hypothetical protein
MVWFWRWIPISHGWEQKITMEFWGFEEDLTPLWIWDI